MSSTQDRIKSTRLQAKEKSKVELFFELSKFDGTNPTDYISTSLFEDKYSGLILGNGGSWMRMDGTFCNNYKVCTVKHNKTVQYSWLLSDSELETIALEIEQLPRKKGSAIAFIKIFGPKEVKVKSKRTINKVIRDKIKHSPCVVCGSNHQIEVDHKNGLLNDPRVWNSKTQVDDDFQALCKHCNDQKRQSYVWQKLHKKRYPASMIPQLKVFKVDFIQGGDAFDEADPKAMIGTYWYDPIAFLVSVSEKTKV
jgi:hypothetical protein